MDNREFKNIIDKIVKEKRIDLSTVLGQLGNRSYLSKFLNLETSKKVTKKLLEKSKNAYPSYFGEKTTENNTPDVAMVSFSSSDIKDLIVEKEKALQAHITFLQRLVESNLADLLSNQNGGIGILVEVLQRDVYREAKGNQGKANKILDEIVRRIGPNSGKILKMGIHNGEDS